MPHIHSTLRSSRSVLRVIPNGSRNVGHGDAVVFAKIRNELQQPSYLGPRRHAALTDSATSGGRGRPAPAARRASSTTTSAAYWVISSRLSGDR